MPRIRQWASVGVVKGGGGGLSDTHKWHSTTLVTARSMLETVSGEITVIVDQGVHDQ